MHFEERAKPPSDADRVLWLVRGDDAPHADAGNDGAAGRTFEWYQSYESPSEIAAFQREMRALAVRHATAVVEQEEESVRASRVANRIAENDWGKSSAQRSRRSTVRFVRSVVILVALTWALTLGALESVGVHASGISPGAVFHGAVNLIRDAETAVGERGTQQSSAQPAAMRLPVA